MAKSDRKKELEFYPDAWQRFETFIRDVAKAGPQHRTSKQKRRRKSATKKRAR